MKSTLITITFLFLSIHLTAQVSQSIIGKWVPIKTDFYSDSELEDTVKQNSNKTCVSYIEFLKGGTIMTKDFTSNCEEIKAAPGTFNHIGEDWYKISVDELKDEEVQIQIEGNQMKMYINTGERSKAVALLKRYNDENSIKVNKKETSQASQNIIGKWAPMKFEVYIDNELESSKKNNNNNKCRSFFDFQEDGVIMIKDFNPDCEEIKVDPGTFNHIEDDRYKISIFKFKNKEAQLQIDNNQMKMSINITEESKLLLFLKRYSAITDTKAKKEKEDEIMYKDGVKHGLAKYYYPNGQILRTGYYEKGLKTGEWKAYRKIGGLLYIGSYKNDKATGEWKYYDAVNGVIDAIGNFKDDQKVGEWRYYYENGIIKMIGSYLNGKKEGKWNEYFDNEALKSTGYYQNNEKIGVWKFYDKYGDLIKNEKH
ncbi:toxin-antitoxin system YwqK family antitoxin [Mangrovimonas spongiae]|uniref:Toxin-antitoxin system YwqK family antitoxin n=1 Tax=Mangrovimonas spongiae TaxID=2494697 RepID=A0A428JX06_9FLAO|nr:toxin-antitoxin system YwqK family antitoxin [Mangrovimonas spongiae]RSK38625.1 toxin-antitoxin system YwqK family antitoxin [Mangrovimonas spongiae]